MKIGLLSPHFRGKVVLLGNTSGTGAFLALKSKQFNELAYKIIDISEHIELAEELDFTMEFAMNMMFDQQAFQNWYDKRKDSL